MWIAELILDTIIYVTVGTGVVAVSLFYVAVLMQGLWRTTRAERRMRA